MITKKSNNTGAAGGHGMSTIDIEHLQDSELYHDYVKGHVVNCSCGESFRLSPDHSFIDAMKLSNLLNKEGCPFCNKGKLDNDTLNWFMANKKKVIEFSFEIVKEIFVKVIRKPLGWYPLSKKEIQEGYENLQ